MAEVSIIIPAYNAEKYIEECITSILANSFKDYELIVIDDGSTDSTNQLLTAYAKNDSRICLHRQNNAGAAAARNLGMDMAKGEYLMFIDADDTIEESYIDSYVSAIKENDCDVVMGGFVRVKDGQVILPRQLTPAPFSRYIVVGPVAKIYRRSFLIDHHIRYKDLSIGEDALFNMTIIHAGASIDYIDNIGYRYRYNPESISSTTKTDFSANPDILYLVNTINYDDIPHRDLHQYFIIRFLVYLLLDNGKKMTPDQFMAAYQQYFDWLDEHIPSYTSNRNIKPFRPQGEDKQVGLIVWVFMWLHRLGLVRLFSKAYCPKTLTTT